MASEKTYYEILGVSADATEKEIKLAYYKLARDLHPDKAESEEERKTNELLFADVSKAYNVLKDKKRKEEYDSGLKKSHEKEGEGPKEVLRKEAAPRKREEPVKTQERSGERIHIAKKAYH